MKPLLLAGFLLLLVPGCDQKPHIATDPAPPPDTESDYSSIDHKPESGSIHIRPSRYTNRGSGDEWVVCLRVFWSTGSSTPYLGNYQWWEDDTPFDGVDNYELRYSNVGTWACKDGHSNPNLSDSRFKVKVRYEYNESSAMSIVKWTPVLNVGCDVRDNEVEECICTSGDPDSNFYYPPAGACVPS